LRCGGGRLRLLLLLLLGCGGCGCGLVQGCGCEIGHCSKASKGNGVATQSTKRSRQRSAKDEQQHMDCMLQG
jgi:hypothetical protein